MIQMALHFSGGEAHDYNMECLLMLTDTDYAMYAYIYRLRDLCLQMLTMRNARFDLRHRCPEPTMMETPRHSTRTEPIGYSGTRYRYVDYCREVLHGCLRTPTRMREMNRTELQYAEMKHEYGDETRIRARNQCASTEPNKSRTRREPNES